MNFTTLFQALALIVCIASCAQPTNAETRIVGWEDLRPPIPALEDAFSGLTESQAEDMQQYIKWLTSPLSKKDDDDFVAQSNEAEKRLIAAGVDVEAVLMHRREIIVKRNRGAHQSNPDVLQSKIRLPGYVLPLEFNGQVITEFLLVPWVGACLHTPPPATNQIVHVNYEPGIKISGLFEPVWIEGVIEADSSQRDVGYSDGQGQVVTGYSMNARAVEAY